MIRVDVDIAINLKAPFITQSSSPGPYGFDSVHARTSAGQLCIPGTHIVGKLRQAWEELRSSLGGEQETDIVPNYDQIDILLGTSSIIGDFSPRTKQLFFSDFICYEEASEGFRNRIQIDDDRKATRKGALLTIESPFPAGQTVMFNGVLSFETSNDNRVDLILRQVTCGLQWISQIGAYRSVGFGQVAAIQMGKPKKLKIAPSNRQWKDTTGLDLTIEPCAPFCIAGRPTADNIFESMEDIPGGVIRGCLANKINHLLGRPSGTEIKSQPGQTKLAKLCENFHRIRITHGFASARCFVRPVRPPFSLVKAGGLYDVALMETPCLINDQAPEFQVDWKDDADVKTLFGWPQLKKELRVRTAIDSDRLRSADDQLFAYEMVVPDDRCWLARIQLDKAIPHEDRDVVLNDLAMLLESGLLGLGKYKTSAKLSASVSGTIVDEHNLAGIDRLISEDGLWAITLQTPALLVSPRHMMSSGSAKELFEGYRSAWAEICPALSLVRFFARQSLSGGLYRHGRFQGVNADPYNPWILTDAGSVFIFTSSDLKRTRDDIRTWLKHGLEIPGATLAAYDLTHSERLWRKCPFVPQNGFGEIAVNLEIHSHKKPQPGRCYSVEILTDEEV
jgi:CRISPR/Cas system CSM-associated protein Csm3 (group 7 of RAMP superfamily)